MPVNEIAPSLQQFLQIASSSADNRTIRSTDKGLSSTRLPTWASTNQKTMSNFISALTAEFGSQIADAAASKLATLTNSGNKPLKAFMIRDAVNEAISTKQANLNIRDKFFSGIDPAHSFETKFAEILQDPKNFSLPIDEENKALFKETLRQDICEYMALSSNKLSTEDLERRLSALSAVDAAKQLFKAGSALSVLPGAPADKMNVAHMLDYNFGLCTVAMQKLPLCRMIQPEGALTRATVWQAAAGSPMPEEMNRLSDREFGEAIGKAFSAKLEKMLGSEDKANRVMSSLGNVKLESAIDIVKTGRPLTKDDFISSTSRLDVCARTAKNNYAERSVAKDICRMGNTNKNGQPVFAGVNFHTAQGTVETMPFGRAAKETFQFRNDADKAAFSSGSPSSFTQELLGKCRTICGGSENQAQVLLSLFSQTTLHSFAAQGNISEIGTLIPTELNEHMAMSYDISSLPDGSVRMELHSNEASERAGRASMTIIVAQDGTPSMESCKIESAANVREQNLRSMIADSIAAPTLSPSSKAKLADMIGDILVQKGLHMQDPDTWQAAIEPLLAQFQSHTGIMNCLRTIPQGIESRTAQTICTELKNSISSYYQKTCNQMNENGIFPVYIKDAERHSIASINGEGLRFVPNSHTGPVPLTPGSELPATAIIREGLQEQLMDAVPDRGLRGFVSQVASQAGLEGSFSIHLMGVEPDNSTPPWPNYVNLQELAASSSGVTNFNFTNHSYTITTDELVPGRGADDPVNEGRGIHIQLNITQGLEGKLPTGEEFSGELTHFTMQMDIPYNQPPHTENEPPVFSIHSLECHPA